MEKIGVLLMNIGTPDDPSPESVERYLQEFLTDPQVIQAPLFVRKIFFAKFIIPKRAPQSAKKYQKIWTPEGSPLMVHSKNFARALQEELSSKYEVQIGMRCGNPSIQTGLEHFKKMGVSQVLLVPLYPQFAAATVTSSLNAAMKEIGSLPYKIFPEFFNSASFIDSCAAILETTRPQWEHLLFTFHGLPVSQVKKTKGCYQSNNCCENFERDGRRCYRAQCFKTAQLLAQKLNLKSVQWSVSFQSRLGPAKWMEPYTEMHLKGLAQSGVRKLGVFAPSFVVDGLETLEEIAMEGRQTFLDAGGESLSYIPCLNDSELWVQSFSDDIEKFCFK